MRERRPGERHPLARKCLKTGLPSRELTPGATNAGVTQASIQSTICRPGWTATIQPTTTYLESLKAKQLPKYGFANRTLSAYEEDHLISLDLGGSAKSAANLWPQPRHIKLSDGKDVGSATKNAFERHLKAEVCAGRLSLLSAQRQIALNWVGYWRKWKSAPAALIPNVQPTPSPITTALPIASAAPTAPPTAPPTLAPTPSPTLAVTATPTATPTPATGGMPASVQQAKAAGASAVCRDGTWSYSANRSGTCSHHGGVYWWTGNLGAAGPGG